MTFTMPADSVKLEPLYMNNDKCTASVVDGSARFTNTHDGTDKTSESYNIGSYVIVEAKNAASGEMFQGWSCSDPAVNFLLTNNTTTAFVMPDNNVTVRAIFSSADTNEYSVQTSGCTAEKAGYMSGEIVKIKADAAPAGKVFH